MGNILGEPFKEYVQKQIKVRQKIHGSGALLNDTRTLEEIEYLNSRNSWVKLASGVSLDKQRMDLLKGNPLVEGVPLGKSLARGNILWNGLISNTFTEDFDPTGATYSDRAGIEGGTFGAYGVGGFGGNDGDFGFSPMPGIVEAEVKTLNRGSIKKASVTIKAHNKYQFDVIDVLYLRLGYSVMLEFGYSKYYDNNESFTTADQSLINDENWFDDNFDKSDYQKWLPEIEERRERSGGNYEGVFGVISNFTWSFEADGSYNIKLEIMSLGDVIESLKMNLPPTNTEGLSAQEALEISRLVKQTISETGGGLSLSEDQFYTVYQDLDVQIREWFDLAKSGNGPLMVDYTLGEGITDWLTTLTFPNDFMTYLYPAGVTFEIPNKDGSQTFTPQKAQQEINNILEDVIRYALKFTFEPAVEQEGLGGFSDITGYSNNTLFPLILATQTANLNYPTVGATALSVAVGDQKRAINFRDGKNLRDEKDNEIKGVNYVAYYNAVGIPVYTWTSDAQILSDGQKLFYSPSLDQYYYRIGEKGNVYDSNYLIYNIKYYTFIAHHSWLGNIPLDQQKFLMNNIDFDSFMELVFVIFRYFYLNVNFTDSDDFSAGDPEADSVPDDDVAEKSQFQLDTEQRGKNRVREYLYNIRYFDTVKPNTELAKVASERQRLEEIRNSTFETSGNTFVAEDIPLFIVNPSLEAQVYDFEAGQLKVAEDDPDPVYAGTIGNKKEGGKIVSTMIEEWNEAGLFPPYNDSRSESHQVDIVSLTISEPQYSYYIRLGTFLDFLQERIFPKIEGTNNPILTIDTDSSTNICYAVDNSISLDPRKMIVGNSSFRSSDVSKGTYSEQNEFYKMFADEEDFKRQQKDLKEKSKVFPELKNFLKGAPIDGEWSLWGSPMNIYLNFNRIQEIFDGVDSNNELSCFKVLQDICNDINECMGGLNNLEPRITSETPKKDSSYFNEKSYSGNTVQIIDQTAIPNIEKISKLLGLEPSFKEEKLGTFGYNEEGSNFIRKVGLNTQIDKNYATMITIGATANGSIPGAEATAFSKWNVGIHDRFKNEVVDAISDPDSLITQNAQVIEDYASMTKSSNKVTLLGFNADLTINTDAIEVQKNTFHNFYVFCQAKISEEEEQSEGLESSVGFLPFNLNLDLDGLGGIKIYQRLNVDTRFLPTNYPETLKFLITGINHKLSGNDWVTHLDTIATSKSVIATDGKLQKRISTPDILQEILPEAELINSSDPKPASEGPGPEYESTPPPTKAGAWKVIKGSKAISSAYDLTKHHSYSVWEDDPKQVSGGWSKTGRQGGEYMYDMVLKRTEDGTETISPYVPSPVDGKISFLGFYKNGQDSAIEIKSDHDGKKYKLLHMDTNNALVNKGDTVKKGTLLARQSNFMSGAKYSPNIHLHIAFPDKQILIDYVHNMVNDSFPT